MGPGWSGVPEAHIPTAAFYWTTRIVTSSRVRVRVRVRVRINH